MSETFPADELEAEFGELRDELIQELGADTFQVQSPTQVADGRGGFTEGWVDVAETRGLLQARTITSGERLNTAGVVVSNTVYQAMLPYGLPLTTDQRLVCRGRIFGVTDVIRTGAVGGPMVAQLEERQPEGSA